MILLANVFDISTGGQAIAGMKRRGYNVNFPCEFDLYNGYQVVARVTVQTMVMDNNSIVMNMRNIMDNEFERITLWANEGVEKILVNGRVDAYLLPSVLRDVSAAHREGE